MSALCHCVMSGSVGCVFLGRDLGVCRTLRFDHVREAITRKLGMWKNVEM